MTTRAQMVIRITKSHPQFLGIAARALLRNLSVFLDYPFLNGYSFPPKSITFRISGKCNLSCKMCIYHNADFLDTADMFPLPLFKDVINQIAPNKLFVGFTGGEPLLHPHIIDCLTYVKGKGLSCSLVTNGWNLALHATDLVKSGLDLLTISLDGPGEIHDRIRGQVNSYQRALDGIGKVLQHKNRPLVFISASIQSDSYEYISDLVDEAMRVGVDGMNVQALWTRTPDRAQLHNQLFPSYPVRDGWMDESLINIKFDVLGDVLKKARRKDFFVNVFPFSSIDQLRMWYLDPLKLIHNHRQLCPWMFSNVFHDGTMRTCDDIVLGNLENERFWDIWNSERTRALRRTLRQHKNFPICAGCCSMFRDFAM